MAMYTKQMGRQNADTAKSGVNSETVDIHLDVSPVGMPKCQGYVSPPKSSVKCCSHGGTCNATY